MSETYNLMPSLEFIGQSPYLSHLQYRREITRYITSPEEGSIQGVEFISEMRKTVGILEFVGGEGAGNIFETWQGQLYSEWQEKRGSVGPNISVDDKLNVEIPLNAHEVFMLMRLTNLFQLSGAIDRNMAHNGTIIAVESGTGIGKSSALRIIESEYEGMITREHVDNNWWLPHSASPDHEVSEKSAFAAQLHFLLGRIEDLLVGQYLHQNGENSDDMFISFADRFLDGDWAYVENHHKNGNISNDELELLTRIKDIFLPAIPKEENWHSVFLYSEEQEHQRRVEERGRVFEQGEKMPGVLVTQGKGLLALGITEDVVFDREGLCRYINEEGNDILIIDTTKKESEEVAGHIAERATWIWMAE